jgi:hypothetical protein
MSRSTLRAHDPTSVRHVKVVVNVIAKIVTTMPRNRANNHDVVEFDQRMDLIPKMLVCKIGSD